jgi:DNA-3-methyladenine glycosylase II
VPLLAVQQPASALRACGLSGSKVRALVALATAEAAGSLDGRRLARLPTEDRQAALLALHGIGPWSAQMAALFYFREPDIWPVGDVSVRKTFARYVDAQTRWDFDGAAALFAPRRSLLARYLWRLADATP